MWNTPIDLPVKTRKAMIDLLQVRLADALDLWSQAKYAHWNVKGANFMALHELFDRVAAESDDWADDLAERLVQLGGTAEGTLRRAASHTTLAEFPDVDTQTKYVEALSHAMANFGSSIRESISKAADAGDDGTADLFTEISRAVDKLVWFVAAHEGHR